MKQHKDYKKIMEENVSLPADLSNLEGINALVDELPEESLDILVNNAGASWGEPIDDYSEKCLG